MTKDEARAILSRWLNDEFDRLIAERDKANADKK